MRLATRGLDRVFRGRGSTQIKTLEQKIKDLFREGQQGAWYDPSDLSTMFADSAGTTPASMPGNGSAVTVGLQLDKSKGLVLGSELVDTANTAAAWTPYGTNTVTQDGDAVKVTYVDNASGAYLFFTEAGGIVSNPVVGKTYKLTLQAKVSSGASVNIGQSLNGGATSVVATVTATDYVTVTVYASPTTALGWYIRTESMGAGESIWIRNISVRELPGNHRFQATSTSRPALSARYNLLAYTEQFDNAAWLKLNTSVSPDAVSGPFQSTLADKLIANTTSADHDVYINYNLNGLAFRFSVYAKAGEYGVLRLRSGGANTLFNLSNGTVISSTSGASSPAIVPVGDGYYLCSTTIVNTGSTPLGIGVFNNTSGFPFAGNGTSGIYIWGADLRAANEPASLPPYQRVVDALTYDTAGFPLYLQADGSDDWMQTNSVDFSASDKVFVAAGVRKLNTSAAFNSLVETGTGGADGFGIFAPDANNNNYSFFLKTQSRPTQASTYIAPISNVISVLHDCSQTTAALQTKPRINGGYVAISPTAVLVASSNFANQAIYFYRRAGTSLPFNGRDYGMVIRSGALPSDAQIAQVERYLSNKMGGGFV